MEHFDDIPIQQLNKAEGYKDEIKVEEEKEQKELEEEEQKFSLLERADHPKWQIRKRAYNEIGILFYEEYSKSITQKKDNLK